MKSDLGALMRGRGNSPPDQNTLEPRFLVDNVSMEMITAMHDYGEFHASYVHFADGAMSQAFGHLDDGRWLDCYEGLAAVRNYQLILEKEIEEVVSAHSIPYWLMLCHRIRPDANAVGVSAWTELLARLVLDTAVMKYGSLDADKTSEDVALVGTYWRPSAVVDYAATLTAYRVERLALELYWSAAMARCLAKNGLLRIVYDEGRIGRPVVENGREDQRLIELYDERYRKYATSGGFLLTSPKRWSQENSDERNPYELLVPALNVEGSKEAMMTREGGDGQIHSIPFGGQPVLEALSTSNYVIRVFDACPYVHFVKQMESESGATIHGDTACLLVTLCQDEIAEALRSVGLMYELVQRGYLFQDIDAFFLRIAPVYRLVWRDMFGKTLSMSDCRKSMVRAYRALSLDRGQRETMVLPQPSPCPVFVPVSREATIVNYSSIPYWVHARVIESLRTGGNLGTLRGRLFEETVIAGMSGSLPDFRLWRQAGDVLTMKDGTRMEFDAAYLRGSLLVVIEDKNQVHSDQFERGDTGAPTRRFGQYDRYLQKLRRKAAALLANRHGRNYNLPDQVTSVLSVILSVDVEYIAEQRSDLFLTRDIPVICTLQELIDYLSRTTNEDIAKSPWLLTT